MLCRVLATLRLVTEAHLQGVFNLTIMGKRIIYTEDGSKLGAEIEMFVNVDGNVTVVIKYYDDCDADLRLITLRASDFNEMITTVSEEINEFFEDGK